MPKKIILDCDPGHDDAVAIMLAAASKEIEILGITCVGGNVGLDNTVNNALKVCTLIERTDLKVFSGAKSVPPRCAKGIKLYFVIKLFIKLSSRFRRICKLIL